MTAISDRQPEVNISYNTPTGRKTKHFSNAHQAKSFYVRQDRLGNSPSVHRSETMPTTAAQAKEAREAKKQTAATEEAQEEVRKRFGARTKKSVKGAKTKKASAKKKAPKKSVKKATPKKRAAAGERPDYLRKPQLAIMALLVKSKDGMTRQELGGQVPGSMAEHLGSLNGTSNKWTKGLLEWRYVKAEQHDEDGKDVVRYTATALGRKAFDKQKD